jgi:cytochrome bd-type quinol oxidase subunit 2
MVEHEVLRTILFISRFSVYMMAALILVLALSGTLLVVIPQTTEDQKRKAYKTAAGALGIALFAAAGGIANFFADDRLIMSVAPFFMSLAIFYTAYVIVFDSGAKHKKKR